MTAHAHEFIDPVGADGIATFNDPICAVCGNHPELLLPPPPPPRVAPVHVHDYVPLPRKEYGYGILGDAYIYCRTCGEKKWVAG